MKPAAYPAIRYPDRDDGPWELRFHFAELDGRVECVGVDIRSVTVVRHEDSRITYRALPYGEGPQPLTAAFVRSLPIGSLMSQALGQSASGWRWVASGEELPEGTRRMAAAKAETLDEVDQRGRRRDWTPERLADVAKVYRRALNMKQPPTKAVAEHFTVSSSMAAKLVHRCRKTGLLGSTDPGKAGG